MSTLSLIFDSQCIICKTLVAKFIEPALEKQENSAENNENKKTLKPLPYYLFEEENKTYFQNLSLEEKQIIEKRSREEILLFNSERQEFIGGIDAVKETLQFLRQNNINSNKQKSFYQLIQSICFSFIVFLLKINFLKPLNTFIYKSFALNRYSWVLIPPYLRCAECELKVAWQWHAVFLAITSFLTLLCTFISLQFWFQALSLAAPNLFATLPHSLSYYCFLTLLISSFAFVVLQVINLCLYKKIVGVNKIEPLKQAFLTLSIFSIISVIAVPACNFLAYALSPYISAIPSSLSLLFVTSVFTVTALLSSLEVYARWEDLSVNKVQSILLLFIDALVRLISPFIVISLFGS